MAEIVYMPKLSDTMTEGVVAAWNKKVGEDVKEGEILAEIETDKATMEFESFYDGVLLHIGVAVGDAAPINSILAIIGSKDEDVAAILSSASTPEAAEPQKEEKEAAAPVVVSDPAPVPAATAPAPVASSSEKIFASPLAKKLAGEKGINLNDFWNKVKTEESLKEILTIIYPLHQLRTLRHQHISRMHLQERNLIPTKR